MASADAIHFTEEIRGEKVSVVFSDGTRTKGRVLDYTQERLKMLIDEAVLEFKSDSVSLVTNEDGDSILPMKEKPSTLSQVLEGCGCIALVLLVLGAISIATTGFDNWPGNI
jgi:hypothetical protein